MTVLDVALVVVLAFFAVRGFFRGFVRETMGLAALLGAALAAATWATPGGDELLRRELVPPELALVAAGGGIFLAVYVAVNLLGVGIDRLARKLFLGPLLRVAGVLFAIVKGAAITGIVLLAARQVAPSMVTEEELDRSVLARPVLEVGHVAVELGGDWLAERERGAEVEA